MKKIVLSALLLLPVYLQAQIITTFAGNGIGGYTGDGGPATAASIGSLAWITIDAAGNTYIGDVTVNDVIRKITNTGIISTVAGIGTAGFSGDGGPATSAQLNYPESIVVDLYGSIFFSDELNQRIRKISTSVP